MSEKEIADTFFKFRPSFLSYATKRLHEPYFTGSIDAEVVVDNMLSHTLILIREGKAAGFNNQTHLKKYFYSSLYKMVRIAYCERKRKYDKEHGLTDNERMENFRLAREIINRNRSIKT
jgi:hypothetical protein